MQCWCQVWRHFFLTSVKQCGLNIFYRHFSLGLSDLTSPELKKKCAVSVVIFFFFKSIGSLLFGVFSQWVWQCENEDVCTCKSVSYCDDSGCYVVSMTKKSNTCQKEIHFLNFFFFFFFVDFSGTTTVSLWHTKPTLKRPTSWIFRVNLLSQQ